MAEVGVLNLTIHDNSESAGEGLKHLADALNAVKDAKKGFNLSNVGQQVVQLAQTIQQAKGTSTIIKNLGTMFTAINKFSKLKDFTIDTEKIRSMAENMLKLADAKDRVDEASKSGAGVSDWRNGMGEISKSVLSTKENIEEAADSIQRNKGRIFNLQLFGGRGTKKSEGQIGMDLDGLQKQTEGLVEVQSQIQSTTQSMNGLKESIANTAGPVRAIDLDKYIGNPLDSIRMKATMGGTAMERFWDTFAIKAPTQSLDAMEKAIAGNAELAKKEINDIIKLLDKRISYKGLGEFVNAKTGVTGGSQGQNIINESTTMLGALVDEQEALEQTKAVISEVTEAQIKLNDAGEAYAGQIAVFDQMSGTWKRIYADTSNATEAIETAAEETRNIIDLTQIPASGKNGAFANAAEEARYLQREIENAIASQQQWDGIYNAAAKQMKYGGPRKTEDLEFDMRHAAEGYDAAYEAEIRYRDAFAELLGYAKEYRAVVSETVAETVKSTDQQTSNVESFNREIQEIVNSAEPALSKIELLQNKVAFLRERLARLYASPAFDELGQDTGRNNAINETLLQIGRVNEQIQKLIDKSHEAQQAMQFDQMKSSAAGSISQRVQWTEQDISNLVDNYSQIDLMELKLRGMQQALLDDINQNKVDTQAIAERTMAIKNLQDKIDQLKNSQEEATETTRHLGFSFGDLRSGIKKAFPFISSLKNRLKNIITRRAIMYMIRQITSGLKEGVEHVYEYSKLIGSAFAPAMDSAKSSLAQMKNALGAAVAPLLQMLIPVLQQVVSWFINLLNYANQFFALLNGQKTWTRALPQTVSAFDKQTKAAKSAGAAIKDLLADWDELNIIQSESGGGGSGAGTTAAEDYLNMFEEVDRFDSKVKDVVNFIKENFSTILTVAEAIGAAILMWKISRAFGNTLGLLQSLELAAGLTLLITGIKMAADSGYSIGKDGINGENVQDAVCSVVSSMIGGGLIGLAVGGPIGALIGLTVGTILSLVVLYMNINRGHLDSLYGNVHKEVDEIVADLEEGILSPETKVTIDVIDASIKSIESAETKVSDALNDLSKSYPVGVTVNPDNAQEFKNKVDALVTETNNLISTSEDMLAVTVPATAAFTENFVSEAWTNVSEYVTELGKLIGEELDKSITDNTRLDDLKEKLLQVSRAVLTATRSSELVSQIGVAGAATRENSRLGQYDRETVKNYMEQYNLLLKEKMGEATGFAQAEFVEKNRLKTSLEESIEGYLGLIEKGGLTEEQVAKYRSEIEDMTKQLEVVKKEIQEKFGEKGEKIASVAQAYYDEWTLTGRTMYAQDIAGALTAAMSKNTNQWQLTQRLMGASSEATFDANLRDPDKYIKYMYRQLADTISGASGMKTEDLMDFFETSGVNPLSMFNEDFIKQYQDNIISWLGKSAVTDEERKKILEAFGLNFDDEIKERLAKVELGNLLNGKDKFATNNILQNWLSTSTLTDAQKEHVLEMLGFSKKSVESTTVTPDGAYLLDDSTLEGIRDHLNWYLSDAGYVGGPRSKYQKEINSLFDSGALETMQELKNYIEQYGIEIAFDMLRNYLNGQDWTMGNNSVNTKFDRAGVNMNPERVTGRNFTVSDVGWGNNTNANATPVTEQDLSRAVETGTSNANKDQNELLNNIQRGIEQLLRKQWTVNITPSTMFGFVGRKSNEQVEMITGNP